MCIASGLPTDRSFLCDGTKILSIYLRFNPVPQFIRHSGISSTAQVDRQTGFYKRFVEEISLGRVFLGLGVW